MPDKSCNAYRGFTLVELVITIIIISVLSAVAISNITARNQHSVTVQADQFRRALSHLQLLAISQSLRLRLSTSSTNYTAVSCTTSACTSTAALTDPATGQSFSVDLTDGAAIAPANNILDFDSLGRPQSSGSLKITTSTYTLSGNGNCVQISVLPITGFASAGAPYAC